MLRCSCSLHLSAHALAAGGRPAACGKLSCSWNPACAPWLGAPQRCWPRTLHLAQVVGVLDGVASPEDCCRACHASTINCTVRSCSHWPMCINCCQVARLHRLLPGSPAASAVSAAPPPGLLLQAIAAPCKCSMHAGTLAPTARSSRRPQVWNWCDPTAATNGTCFYEAAALTREAVTLQALQCAFSGRGAVHTPGHAARLICRGQTYICIWVRHRAHGSTRHIACARPLKGWLLGPPPAACRPAAAPAAGSPGDWQPPCAAGQGAPGALHRGCTHERVGGGAARLPEARGPQYICLWTVRMRRLPQVRSRCLRRGCVRAVCMHCAGSGRAVGGVARLACRPACLDMAGLSWPAAPCCPSARNSAVPAAIRPAVRH